MSFTLEPGGVDRERPLSPPIATVADALGPVETRGYDADGRVVSIANGAGETTHILYDADEMVSRVVAPSGFTVAYSEYGPHGRPGDTSSVLGSGTTTYDAVGNALSGVGLDDGGSGDQGGLASRTFDADRNVSSLLLANQWYEAGDQLETGTLAIEVRSDGRRTRITRPSGGDSEFVYDSLGRLVERRDRAGGAGHADWQSTTFEYDAAGRMTAHTRPNGMREETSYDALGRRTARALLRHGALESIATFEYADGRLARIFDSAHADPESIFYDGAGRPMVIAYPDGESQWFAYDARSRIVATTLVGDDLELIRTLTYEYDGADRETAFWEDGVRRLTREYADGRLVRTEYGNGLEREVIYDPFTAFLDAIETRFVDGGAVVELTDVSLSPTCGLARHCIGSDTETFGSVSVLTGEFYGVGQAGPSLPEVEAAGPRIFTSRRDRSSRDVGPRPALRRRPGARPRTGQGLAPRTRRARAAAAASPTAPPRRSREIRRKHSPGTIPSTSPPA